MRIWNTTYFILMATSFFFFADSNRVFCLKLKPLIDKLNITFKFYNYELSIFDAIITNIFI